MRTALLSLVLLAGCSQLVEVDPTFNDPTHVPAWDDRLEASDMFELASEMSKVFCDPSCYDDGEEWVRCRELFVLRWRPAMPGVGVIAAPRSEGLHIDECLTAVAGLDCPQQVNIVADGFVPDACQHLVGSGSLLRDPTWAP